MNDFYNTLYSKIKAKIKNRYNQVPHLTQDTAWESDKTQEDSQEVSPFPTGDNKDARNRHDSIAKTNTSKKKKQIHRLGLVHKKITGGLKPVSL